MRNECIKLSNLSQTFGGTSSPLQISATSCEDCLQVTMMLVCTTLGVAFPDTHGHILDHPQQSLSKSSRGSSAILSELDRQDTFAPETPPQNLSLLDSECSSC